MPQENFTLNNDVIMPALGLGVLRSPQDETASAVKAALDCGYRLIDTASIYGNEAEVGEGIARSDVPREDIFVTTKLWMPDYGEARNAFEASRQKLGVDYVDLYLLHWPVPDRFDLTLSAYKEAEKLLAEGKILALGVSNFNPDHLEALLASVSVVPTVNQIEVHPFLTQKALIAENKRRGIITQAWSPLGGIFAMNPDVPKDVPSIFDNETIGAIAAKHGKSPAQVVIRWHLQNGLSVIPKSVTPERITSNFDVFGFVLSSQEMLQIDQLNADFRGGPHPNEFEG